MRRSALSPQLTQNFGDYPVAKGSKTGWFNSSVNHTRSHLPPQHNMRSMTWASVGKGHWYLLPPEVFLPCAQWRESNKDQAETNTVDPSIKV